MLRSLKPICLAATLAWIVGTGNAAELPLAEQETQGRAFAQKLLQLAPRQQYEGNATFLRVGPNGAEPVVRAQFQIYHLADTGTWVNYYRLANASAPTNGVNSFAVFRRVGKPAEYAANVSVAELATAARFQGSRSMQPFAGSDFWLADFGFEFLGWDKQRKLKEEMCRSQMCVVLESENAKPEPGAYARVESWIDKDTHGLIQAFAYDAKGEMLKVFKPKSFRKIGGDWQLQEMEIRNLQTRTRTTITFDLVAKPK